MCGTCDTADALAVVAEAHRVASSLAAARLSGPGRSDGGALVSGSPSSSTARSLRSARISSATAVKAALTR